jgi:hypothetical protein
MTVLFGCLVGFHLLFVVEDQRSAEFYSQKVWMRVQNTADFSACSVMISICPFKSLAQSYAFKMALPKELRFIAIGKFCEKIKQYFGI